MLRAVSVQLLGRRFVSIALVVAALAGCASKLPPPVTLAAPATASAEELRWAIEAALAERRWTVNQRAPGVIGAFVVSHGSGEGAAVDIAYAAGTIEIRCAQQEVSEQRYDRWVQLLSSDIQKYVAQLGMRRPPAPTPPPKAP